MKKTSIMVLFVTVAVILLLLLSPYTTGTSTNPCGSCHPGKVYSQYLDILKGNSANQIPSAIEVGETKPVSVVVENSGNPGTYSTLSEVSVTLTSKNGHFSVNSHTYNIGDLPLGKATVRWQITGVSEGFDSLLIVANGINKQHLTLTFLFSDTYSPSITVGHPSPTPASTPSTASPAAPLSIVLTSPTSGEKWAAGTIHTIGWYTNGGTKPLAITLDYSVSSINESWTTIAAGIADNGSLTWKMPNATATVYIRAFVTDSGNPTQSALIMRNVGVNEVGVPPLIMIPVAVLLITTVLVPVLLKWKKQKQARAKSEVYGK